MVKEISDFLKLNDVEYKENFRLSIISPIKIGGIAEFVVYPKSRNELALVVNFLEINKIKYIILGRMSNTLPNDDNFNGVIIRTDRMMNIHFKGSCLEADAGVSLPHLSRICADMGYSGLEELSGIPGSLGGAVYGNAGAFGREISDLISRVTVYNINNMTFEHLKAEQLCFDYRSSILMRKDHIILSARINLKHSDRCTINRLIQRFRDKRTATQPVGQPSIGSTFKRPSNDIYAAKLIDDCSLKGKKIGGAMISDKHAGFIVNIGGSTALDYLMLAEYVQNKVYETFGIMLEKEIEVI